MAQPVVPTNIKPDWPAPPGVMAFTTTREGGCSAAPYETLNLAHHVGDDTGAVAANRALLAAELGDGIGECQWLQQVHGRDVVQLPVTQENPTADACWTARPGVACAVLTADCLPVLFCDRTGSAVAASHAGWRGLLAGVLEATVNAMGVAPGELLAWLGPAIGPAAFEVGAEVRAAFVEQTVSSAEREAIEHCFVPAIREQHFFADLYALARLRLATAGVTAVYGGELCTFTDSQRFFSYRRDGETGRMASVIALRL